MKSMYDYAAKQVAPLTTNEQKKIATLEAKYAKVLEKLTMLEAKLAASERILRQTNSDLANISNTIRRR